MNVLLLRHAESEWNRLGLWQGTEDPPLSDAGRLAAARVAPLLSDVVAVWSSPLVRAAETAQIIADRRELAPVRFDDRLAEVHFGEWQGLTVGEIDARWPGLRVNGRRPLGAESEDEVTVRAMAGITAIAAADGMSVARVLVMTHGGLIRTVCRHLGQPAARAIPNLGGVWLTSDDGRLWRVSDTWEPDLAAAGETL